MAIAPITWFEIPAVDLDRAASFYSALFGVTLERARVDNLDMARFPLTPDAAGISGAIVAGDTYVPSHHGTRVYFNTPDIDATLALAERLGGRELYPKTSIGELGWVAEFEDSEGNRVALHTPRGQPRAGG
jgi:predicted enzyme related to lactoylglutathione lyase